MSSNTNKIYTKVLKDILENGELIETRNSLVKRKTNIVCEFDSTPLVSVRRTAWKNALREFEWFLSGSSNIGDLHPRVRHWWRSWADENGEIKYNYGHQLSNYSGFFKQHSHFLYGLLKHPYSRRHVMTTWNPVDMNASDCPITNCHGTLIQAFRHPDNTLSLTMVQRSADMVLGWQHNLIQYWSYLLFLCSKVGAKPGTLTWHGTDCHVYKDHFEIAEKIINAEHGDQASPNLVYKPSKAEFKADDFYLDSEYEFINDMKIKMIV